MTETCIPWCPSPHSSMLGDKMGEHEDFDPVPGMIEEDNERLKMRKEDLQKRAKKPLFTTESYARKMKQDMIAQLKKHTEHHVDCGTNYTVPTHKDEPTQLGPCDCGLKEILDNL